MKIVSVTGLGYVGLPVAVAFAQKHRVIGFDNNQKRIEELRKHYDRTGEVEASELRLENFSCTTNIEDLRAANFHIVTVPTPVDQHNRPDLSPMLKASQSIGKILKKGDIVVFESTVYPGVCEDECLPVLEKVSGLKGGVDFKIGYSPERINPGDKEHSFTKIKKVVSGQDAESLEVIAAMYGSVVTAGVYKASSIQVAEAAKVIENTQRDLNIALVNELAVIFDRLGIDTSEVLAAASTKWNFIPFRPGLVGGHCIGVDPYYLTHKAESVGYHPQVILSGRKINDSMAKFIADKCIKEMIHAGHAVKGSLVTVMGLTFKENCPDLRNSKVFDIVKELNEFGVQVQVHDPVADPEIDSHGATFNMTAFDDLKPAQAVVFCVAHQEFKQMNSKTIQKLCVRDAVVVDVKGMFTPETIRENGFRYWRL